MQGGKGEKQKYAPDKPDCAYCYFGTRRGTCRRRQCYYLLLEEKEPDAEETCADCPYGKHYPCIGYCTLKILRERKQKT